MIGAASVKIASHLCLISEAPTKEKTRCILIAAQKAFQSSILDAYPQGIVANHQYENTNTLPYVGRIPAGDPLIT